MERRRKKSSFKSFRMHEATNVATLLLISIGVESEFESSYPIVLILKSPGFLVI